MAAEFKRRVVLLFGARGQVGHALQQSLGGPVSLMALNSADADFGRPESLRAIIRECRPDVIVNAAAYTAVDKAENELDVAYAINATSPGVLAEEAEALGACLVHYSTDYVFDGRKPLPYVETDMVSPLSAYGRTKLAGEQAVGACSRHLTFRTSWVVGEHGSNFIKTMLRLAGERDALRVVNDQFGAPTSAALLSTITARILWQMVEQPASDARWGLYHLVAMGETSWHGLARHVIGYANAIGLPLKAEPETIEPIATVDYPLPAKRPANSRLNTFKVRSTFGLTLPDWTIGVNEILDHLIPAMKA